MKLAVAVQRYGADIIGGAELHARQVAERLASFAEVTVLTTCARDYLTWRNELPAGRGTLNGVAIERFPVSRERELVDFARRSELAFTRAHTVDDELQWLDSEGPTTPALIDRLARAGDEFDYCLFFSMRYYHAFHGARAVPERAILVPTAEREPSIGLSIFAPVLRGVRGVMYNSPEERALLASLSGNHDVPGTVVGVGVETTRNVDPERFRRRFNVQDRYVLYVGRIDENKGCKELFDNFRAYARRTPDAPRLLLIGSAVMTIPEDPGIRHLGFVTEEEKFDAIAGASALLMPSYYESLSMVVLEAWALGVPVLVNARCDVLLGHCLRSNGGLFYQDSPEFTAALDFLVHDRTVATALGAHGRAYVHAEYTWPVVMGKYRSMLARLEAERGSARPHRMAPLPGRWARRFRHVPAAATVLERAQSGAVTGRTERAS